MVLSNNCRWFELSWNTAGFIAEGIKITPQLGIAAHVTITSDLWTEADTIPYVCRGRDKDAVKSQLAEVDNSGHTSTHTRAGVVLADAPLVVVCLVLCLDGFGKAGEWLPENKGSNTQQRDDSLQHLVLLLFSCSY